MLQVVKDQHNLLQDWACQWETRSMQQMDSQFQEFTKMVGELREELKGLKATEAHAVGSAKSANGQHLNSIIPLHLPAQNYQKQVAELDAMGRGVNQAVSEPFSPLETPASRAGMMRGLPATVGSSPRSSQGIRSHIPSLNVSESPHLERLRMAEKRHSSTQFLPQFKRKGVGFQQNKETSWSIDMVESATFKTMTTCLILANTLFVGFEVDQDMALAMMTPPEPLPTRFWITRIVFTVAFTVELLLRIAAYKTRFITGDDVLWNIFDSMLVVSQFVEELLEGSNMSYIRIIRLVRLVRTLRVIRVVHFFRHLRMMVCCIFNSLMSLVWALMLLVLVMYLFAIMCVQGSATYIRGLDWQVPPDAAEALRAQECGGHTDTLDELCTRTLLGFNFPGIPRALLAMLMAITGGQDWYELIQPLMMVSPLYAAGLMLYVVFVLFGVLNVLSAVFVDNALQIRDRDLLIHAELEKTDSFLKDMQELFREADADHTRRMSRQELTNYLKNERVMSYMAGHQLDVSDVEAMFKMLDVDNSGMIEENEFVLGALRLKGQARCLDVLRLFSCFDRLTEQVCNIEFALGIAPAAGWLPQGGAAELNGGAHGGIDRD